MKIFLASSAVPRADGSAAHTVLSILIEMICRMGHDVTLQCIGWHAKGLGESETKRVEELMALGVEVLPALDISKVVGERRGSLLRRMRRVALAGMSEIYPATALGDEVGRRVRDSGATAILIFWDPEGLAATYRIRGVRKVAYYGMPDYMASEAMLRHPGLFDIPYSTLAEKFRVIVARHLTRRRREIHFKLMLGCDVTGNICAFHADMYREMGHPRSIYIQNLWPDSSRSWRQEGMNAQARRPAKIVGSLGNVRSTGNTFGLLYLGNQILPRLERRLGSDNFEINIYGHGVPYSPIARSLSHPSVKLRGWVPDLDAEILSSRVFLMMNNTGYYKGSHTRFLHAWTLGSCVVAHRINAAAMPEIQHMENALLGDDPDEISDLIERAVKDEELRRRIGDGGRQTYEALFRPEVVVPKLVDELCSS